MTTDLLELLFVPEQRDRTYGITFDDGERYILHQVVCFGGGDEPTEASGIVVQPVVRRVEAERHFQRGKAMSFQLTSIREVTDSQTGQLLYRAV